MNRSLHLLISTTFFCLLAAAFDTPTAPLPGNESLQLTFLRWAATHSRSYDTVEEMDFRFQQFLRKDAELDEIRASHPAATFTVAHNIFSDRTAEEMAQKLNANYITPFVPAGVVDQPRAASEDEQPRDRVRSGFGDKNWCDSYCNEIQD